MNHSLNICIRKKSRIWRIWKHSFQFYAALSFHVMSFKAFSTLCCGKGSHKTILGQIYISASFLPNQIKRQKKFGFLLHFHFLIEVCNLWMYPRTLLSQKGPDISILGKHGKTRTCISLSYPLMLMSVKEIISSWFTSLCSTTGSN